ncbi:MAG: YitT family protein [Bacteroidetes bacterium]|uniref:YitT family protein n=1 Tax=Candidatus Merdivivens pullicola TaxID=2840872 RepID=A0A9D9NH93_9BACT|nr:YitT family protein [Candidatus Merdivivens pullicola]
MRDSKVFKTIGEYLLITLGIAFYTFAWQAFMIPKGFFSGGVTGIATVLNFATGGDGITGGIPIPVTYFVLNILLLVVGFFVLGTKFGFKTIYAIIVASIFLKLFQGVWISPIEEDFLNALIGGAISGCGIALTFLAGGSTGGTDIVTLVIKRYFNVTEGKVYLIVELLIISSIILIPGKGIQEMVYGYLTIIAFSTALDYILMGNRSTVQILIFSKEADRIADMVLSMGRGVTAVPSVGWYSKQEGKVLIVIAKKNQMPAITRAVKELDDKVFISVCSATGVFGQGFEEVKTGMKKIWKKEDKKS